MKKSLLQSRKKQNNIPTPVTEAYKTVASTTEKFKQYFDQLFKDANLPGPDYFEFAKMTEAMISIPDEKARYSAAYAGLNVQGLDKQKLLTTATEYLKIIETDANNFDSTVDAALKEKVQGKQQEIEAKQKRIAEISREITDLQNQIQVLQHEVKENEEKIESNTGGYKAASESMKQKILYDIEKIKQHIG
jgi:chromosome segregation ATPase